MRKNSFSLLGALALLCLVSASPNAWSAVAIGEALEATHLAWITNGSPAWVGQTNVSHDGWDAAQSGVIANSKTTSIQTTVNGPGTISFWWKVSSEPSNDRLRFYVNDSEKAEISGEIDWQRAQFTLSSGSQTLKWAYSKNSSTSNGLDRAWLDQVIFISNNVPTAPIIETQPMNLIVEDGMTAIFSVLATGSTPLAYRWRHNGNALTNGSGITGATTSALTLSNVSVAQSGNYSVIVSNAAGMTSRVEAVLTVAPLVPVATAVEAPSLAWSTNSWVGQSIVTHDGIDAARSAAIGHSQTSALQTTAIGPGTLSFWWKVSSETNNDTLRFNVGGTEQARISGEVNWQRRVFNIPAGAQLLRWSYVKNGSTTRGLDRAWLDDVRFASSDTLPRTNDVAEIIQRANDFYIRTTTFQSNGWARGVYQTGNMRAYDVLRIDRHRDWALQWATHFQWLGGFRGATNADGQVCGQTYVDLYLLDAQPVRIAAIKAGLDSRVAAPVVDDWWWIDAFYMAGPVYARYSKLYSTNSYLEKMWFFYRDMKVRRGLFSAEHGLWYRDELAKSATTANGQRQFWARGNGWVIAALARVLEQLSAEDPHRAEYVAMLQTMAAALKPLQGADGMWRASLIDPAEVPNPETSSTALITFALAWGIRHGHLDAAEYEPVVARAWNGMDAIALHPDGQFGYSQPQGRMPVVATYDSSNDHGTGAFLLAGCEVYLLPRPITAAVVLNARVINTAATNKIIVAWNANPGKTYQVIYRNALADPWLPWAGTLTTNDSSIRFEDAVSPAAQRFYRVSEE